MKPKVPSPSRRVNSRRRQKLAGVSKVNGNNRKNNVFSMDRTGQQEAPRPRIIAQDSETQRVIIGIGGQRLAFDFTTRITKLKPGTGDGSAPVSVLKQRKGEPGPAKTQKNAATLHGTKESV